MQNSILSGCKVSVVLPASGSGERFGCNTPKQFNVILNEPVIAYTLSTFHRIPFLDHIVVVVNESYVQYVTELVQRLDLVKVTVVQGALTRHRSIFEGLRVLDSDGLKPDVVIIHDAVRIFAEEDLVREVALAAKIHGASGVVRPLVSTVIAEDSDHFLSESLDRQLYRGSEMPQAFQFDVIYQAYHKATDYDFDYGTECLLLAQKYTGTRAKLIPGPDYLWKITYKKDLYSAGCMLKERLMSVDVRCEEEVSNKDLLLQNLKLSCDSRNIKTHSTSPENDAAAKCVVFVYSNVNCDKLRENTDSVSTRKASSAGVHLQTCVVHLYSGEPLSSQLRLSYMDQCEEIGTKHPHLIVSGVVNQLSEDYTRVSEMLASLLWNRDHTLSGQCFFIR